MTQPRFVFLAALLLLSSCQTMVAEIPSGRMDSPEVLGNSWKRVSAQLAVSPSHDLTITDDASARPPDLTSPRLTSGGGVAGAFSYGALERMDVTLKSTVGPSPAVVGLKYQIIGDASPDAEAGNFSFSVSAGIGYWNVNRAGSQRGMFGPGGYGWKSDITEKLTDFAFIMGYRVNDKTLLYLGAFAQNVSLDAKIHHDVSDDLTSPAADYSRSFSGRHRGGNVGATVEFGRAPGFLTLEGVYSHLEYESELKNWNLSAALAVGAYF